MIVRQYASGLPRRYSLAPSWSYRATIFAAGRWRFRPRSADVQIMDPLSHTKPGRAELLAAGVGQWTCSEIAPAQAKSEKSGGTRRAAQDFGGKRLKKTNSSAGYPAATHKLTDRPQDRK